MQVLEQNFLFLALTQRERLLSNSIVVGDFYQHLLNTFTWHIKNVGSNDNAYRSLSFENRFQNHRFTCLALWKRHVNLLCN